MDFVIPPTVPVKVGDSIGAFNSTTERFAFVAIVVENVDVATFESNAV
jgi:hypothetical protein